jgi:hypothetical protein
MFGVQLSQGESQLRRPIRPGEGRYSGSCFKNLPNRNYVGKMLDSSTAIDLRPAENFCQHRKITPLSIVEPTFKRGRPLISVFSIGSE